MTTVRLTFAHLITQFPWDGDILTQVELESSQESLNHHHKDGSQKGTDNALPHLLSFMNSKWNSSSPLLGGARPVVSYMLYNQGLRPLKLKQNLEKGIASNGMRTARFCQRSQTKNYLQNQYSIPSSLEFSLRRWPSLRQRMHPRR